MPISDETNKRPLHIHLCDASSDGDENRLEAMTDSIAFDTGDAPIGETEHELQSSTLTGFEELRTSSVEAESEFDSIEFETFAELSLET